MIIDLIEDDFQIHIFEFFGNRNLLEKNNTKTNENIFQSFFAILNLVGEIVVGGG